MEYLFLIAVGVLGLLYALFKTVESVSQNYLVWSLKRSPRKAAQYAVSLNLPYGKKSGCTVRFFELIKTHVQSSYTIGEYRILHTYPVHESQLLILTKFYIDPDIDENDDEDVSTPRTIHHNFLLKHNRDRHELELFSDLFTDTTNKFQKQEFLQLLMKERW